MQLCRVVELVVYCGRLMALKFMQDASQLPIIFAIVQLYVPLPRDDFSELIVTATREINATLS